MIQPKALCVSIHDVAPATWANCVLLYHALREVAPALPLTWLVVPRYHGSATPAPAMEAALTRQIDAGHELALHGYTHLDSAARRPGLRNRFVRDIYTTGEGEFADIDYDDALQRLDLGLAWFAERGWPVAGFVPPAWLAGSGARRAIRQRPFTYTTSLTHFYCLHGATAVGQAVWSPSLMYSARNAAGRWLSPPLDAALALALSHSPLIRLALHPADARHPALLRHAQSLVRKLLTARVPMTKHGFATLCADREGATAMPTAAL